MPDPGWYRDPQDPTSEEYWDGQSWSGQRRPSTSAQPAYGQTQQLGSIPPAYGQPGHAPPAYGQPGYGQPSYDQPGFGRPGVAGAAPSTSKRRRKLPLVLAAVVVVLVAAGVITYVVWPDSSPSITYDGKQIASADTVLSKAEKGVDALVSSQHGTKNGSTRCYFVQPTSPPKGSKSSDIEDSLRCGPVLFVGGEKSAEYLTVPLVASTSGGQVHLSAQLSALSGATPQSVPSSLSLVRPDGAGPPSGNGGLSVPEPPAAKKNSIVAASLGSATTPKSLQDATITSQDQSVTVVAAGYVDHYGTGADARSAPAGQRLIAFQLESGDGAIGFGGTVQPVLSVDGTTYDIPSATGVDWDVAAVPSDSTPRLQLTANGFTQTLSLPDGTPGSGNIAVLSRAHTTTLIGKDFALPCVYSKGGQSLDARLSVTVSSAKLYFWVPNHNGAHPAAADEAYLAVGVTYLDSSQRGKVFGFDPPLLHLNLPDGTSITPHNIATGPHVFEVFTVPADYSKGTITVGGSTVLSNGVKQTLGKSRTLNANIRAN